MGAPKLKTQSSGIIFPISAFPLNFKRKIGCGYRFPSATYSLPKFLDAIGENTKTLYFD